MRIVVIPLLALVALTGCMSLHANIPEDVIRRHAAEEHGVELAALCTHAGNGYSEGAVTCMAKRRMTCDASGRWVMQDGGC